MVPAGRSEPLPEQAAAASADAEVHELEAPEERTPSNTLVVPVVVAIVACGLAALAVVATVGRFGFNPTDEGFILAQARRILHGEIPHADFVSPRPAGSAVLHVVDLLLPGPAFLVSRVVVTFQVLLAAVALAHADRASRSRWAVLALGIAAGLVNLHTFPLMAWHTVDGIFLVCLGLLALEHARRGGSVRWITAGLVLLGAAAVVKQSFAAAPLLGLGLVAASGRWRGTGGIRRAAVDVGAAAAPGVLYLAVVTAAGGLHDAVEQLGGGRSVVGRPLLSALRHQLLTTGRFGTPFLAFLLCVAVAVVARTAARRRRQVWLAVVTTASSVAAAAMVLVGLVRGGLALEPVWGIWQLWALVVVVVAVSVAERRPDRMGVATVVLGWMVSLSWGYATPNLVAGSLALASLHRLARMARVPRAEGAADPVPARVARPAVIATAALVLVVAAAWSFDARHGFAYRDRPPGELANGLTEASAELRGIRTNPLTAEFMDDIRACIDAHPAARFAVVPDVAAAYVAFDRANALPMDWLFPDELVGQEQRVVDAAEALSRKGDYLVLFQTVPAGDLVGLPALPAATPDSAVLDYGTGLETKVFESLDGQRVACGSFVAVWDPGT